MITRLAPVMALSILVAATAVPCAAAGTSTLNFVMPTGVDPPTVGYLGTSNTVTATGSTLAPTNGVELHGRAQVIGAPSFNDVTGIIITFQSASNVNVKTSVDPTIKGFKAWVVESSTYDPNTTTWTIVLASQAGSAPLTDALTLPNGLPSFGNLTASQGPNPAPISNVVIRTFNLGTARQVPANIIDTTPPTATATPSATTLWSPNGAPVAVTVSGTMNDLVGPLPDTYASGVNPTNATFTVADEYGLDQPSGGIVLTPQADGSFTYTFTVTLDSSRLGNDSDGRQYTIYVHLQDNFGNTTTIATSAIVLHDQSGP